MALYTSSYLKQLSSGKSATMRGKIINESSRTHVEFDIFLSHSYLDKEEVEGIYIELTNLGFSVYVDWIIDPQLNRNNVTKQSAELVRRRLRMCKSLLLAISTNADMSKWMPWELGYVDGHTSQCGIFPVSPQSQVATTFTRAEYLSLYPYVKRIDKEGVSEILLLASMNEYVSIINWATKNEKPSYKIVNIQSL